MRRYRQLTAWTLAVGAGFGLAGLSRAPWRTPATGDALLRLTLSARPERIETCRRLSDAELAGRPAHMRQTMACEGASATYRLRIWRDDILLDDTVLRGSGFRQDRPIYLLRDYPMGPGEHRLKVEMRRVESVMADSGTGAAGAGLSMSRDTREAEEQARRRLEAIPPGIGLETRVAVRAGQVVLVTWDPLARELRVLP